uniref:Protein kinase domain-containing protein n=1 Tax=Aureoumbra lagunensis TaxID=44058 RepID=A0A7S3NDJ5_9STRA
MFQAASEKVGATSISIATATRRGPPGILQLIETFETRSEMVCVVERIIGSLGNIAYNEGEFKALNSRDWSPPIKLGPVEICRGAATLTQALTALHSGAGLFQRRVHFAISPENIWISGGSGDWRLAGLGMSRIFEDGNQTKLRVGETFGNEMDGSFGEILSGAPRLCYCAPELTQGVDVDTKIDVFSLYLIVLELFNHDHRQIFIDCSDSVYQHKTGAARAVEAATSTMNRSGYICCSKIVEILQHTLKPDPLARPEAAAIRPALQIPGVRLLAELDACGTRETSTSANFLSALASLIERADKLYPDGDDSENLLTDDTEGLSALASSRSLRVAVIPTLLRLAKVKGQFLAPQIAACLLSCALRLDSQDFRSRLQPVFEAVLAANNDLALKLIVDAAPIVLEKADAAWAANVMLKAMTFALSVNKPQELYETALRRLAESETLDALVAKASIANPKSSPVADKLVPAICKIAVQKEKLNLALRVLAMKALAACLERPAACPTPALIGQVLPALSKLQVDAEPAMAMCLLGCYDLCAQRAPEAIARHVLPSLVVLLDEKSLNYKQFDMLVTRVQSLLTRVIDLRRTNDYENKNSSEVPEENFSSTTTKPTNDYFASVGGMLPPAPPINSMPSTNEPQPSWVLPPAPTAVVGAASTLSTTTQSADPLGFKTRQSSSPKPQPSGIQSKRNSGSGSTRTGPPKLKVKPPPPRQTSAASTTTLDPFAAPPLSASSSVNSMDPLAALNSSSSLASSSNIAADPFASSGFDFMATSSIPTKNTVMNDGNVSLDPSDPFAGIDIASNGTSSASSPMMMTMPPKLSNASSSSSSMMIPQSSSSNPKNTNNISSAFDFMS